MAFGPVAPPRLPDPTSSPAVIGIGFGYAATPHHQFVHALGTAPNARRRTFRGCEAA